MQRLFVLHNSFKIIICIVVAIFFFSCVTNKPNRRKTTRPSSKCEYLYENDFSKITNSQNKYLFEGDTLSLNIATYECTYTALYISRAMYSRFGKWNNGVKNIFNTYLIWENVDLFLDGNKYNVVTFGIETTTEISCSVMVFDSEGKDMLAEDSKTKKKITDYFANEIRKKRSKKENEIFYQYFIKEFAPDYWKRYKNFPNIKIHIE